MATQPELVPLLRREMRAIIERWSCSAPVRGIAEHIHRDERVLRDEIAVPLIECLCEILDAGHIPERCPVLQQLAERFYAIGLESDQLFLCCATLHNAIVETCVERRIEATALSAMMEVLDGNLSHMLSVFSDQLRHNEQMISRHAKIIEEHVLLSATDAQGRVTHITDAFCRLSGYEKEEWIGNTHAIIRHPDIPDLLFAKMWTTISRGEEWKAIIKNRKKNGQTFIAKTRIIPIFDASGEIVEYIAIREDVTDKELVNYDPLTKIYNRRMFDTIYADLFNESLIKDTGFSLLIADLDHFKAINDTFGHQEGDDVLRRFAAILQKNLRSVDTCARWGGEEFAVLLPGTPLRQAVEVAERLRRSVELNLRASDTPQTCSIGVAAFVEADSEESLFERADRALYRAKEGGRNRVMSL